MANKTLFASLTSWLPRANTRNEAGGHAYTLPPRHALAQFAATGCLNGTYYASAETQLETFKGLINQVDDPVFLAKLAVYSLPMPRASSVPSSCHTSIWRRT